MLVIQKLKLSESVQSKRVHNAKQRGPSILDVLNGSVLSLVWQLIFVINLLNFLLLGLKRIGPVF